MSLRDLRRSAGRLAIVGFAGESMPRELGDISRAFDLGGVIYFARNIVEPAQVRDLSREVASLARDWPLWISVDQEGGRVARLRRPFTEWPPMATLGRSGDVELARRFARALGAELAAVGVNLDYAPVLDVHTNPRNPVIGDRALADRADEVARLGRAIVLELQAAGVAACGKHFPGHGDTSTDSHHELPVVEHALDRLAAVELVPFRAAIEAGVACLMTAHVRLTAIDDTQPATFSPRVVDALLRRDLGFEGVVLSDDLGMAAIAATTPLADAMVRAIAAGCDAALLCNSTPDEQVAAIEAVIHAVEDGRLPLRRVEDALARQNRVKERSMPIGRRADHASLEVIGCTAHQQVAEAMAAWL